MQVLFNFFLNFALLFVHMSETDKFPNLLVSLGETRLFSGHFTFFLGSAWWTNFILDTCQVVNPEYSSSSQNFAPPTDSAGFVISRVVSTSLTGM